MKYAKLFSLLVPCVIGIYGAIGLYLLPLASFEGDLTRVGKLPESQFGWEKPQPEISTELMQPASWQDADVLVIGDSFSETRVWQSVLVKHGLRVRTEHWTSIRQGICQDFYPWVRSQGFKGKWVIIEVVERNIEGGLPAQLECKHVEYHPSVHANAERSAPLTTRPLPDRSGRLSVGIETWQNLREYHKQKEIGLEKWDIPGGATLHRVSNGCELFSHSSCEDALFYDSDRPEDIDIRALDSIEQINKRMGNFIPIWVFAPNKSTVYLYPDKQFWNLAEKRLHSPNLLHIARQAIDQKTIDLYPGNNSHLSTRGYLLMGEEIFKTMQQLEYHESTH